MPENILTSNHTAKSQHKSYQVPQLKSYDFTVCSASGSLVYGSLKRIFKQENRLPSRKSAPVISSIRTPLLIL